jgi:hypothetical protein
MLLSNFWQFGAILSLYKQWQFGALLSLKKVIAIWRSFMAVKAMPFSNTLALNKQWRFGALLLLKKQCHLLITYC